MEIEEGNGGMTELQKKYPELKGEIFVFALDRCHRTFSPSHYLPSQIMMRSSSSPLTSQLSALSSPTTSHVMLPIGLCLAGSRDLNKMSTFVAGILPGSVAQNDGRIRIGDELIEVDKQIIYGRSHLNASAIIKANDKPILSLVIHRSPDALDQMAVLPVKNFPLLCFQDLQTKDDVTTSLMTSSVSCKGNPREKFSCNTKPSIQQQPQLQRDFSRTNSTLSDENDNDDDEDVGTEQSFDYSKEIKSVLPSVASSIIIQQNSSSIQQHSQQNLQFAKQVEVSVCTSEAVQLSYECEKAETQANSAHSFIEQSSEISNNVGEKISRVDKNVGNDVEKTSNDAALLEVDKKGNTAATKTPATLLPHSESLASNDIPFDNEDDDDDDEDEGLIDSNHQNQLLQLPNEDHHHLIHHHHHHHHHHQPVSPISEILLECDSNFLKSRPIIEGDESVLIEIDRSRAPVGLVLIGGQDTVMKFLHVREIVRGGAVETDGRLNVGDQILEINGEDVRQSNTNRAQHLLQKSTTNVRFLVRRCPNQTSVYQPTVRENTSFSVPASPEEEAPYDSFTLEIFRKLGKGLGVCLKSRSGDVGVVISQIMKGGPAEADGRLMIGDEITSINGTEVFEWKTFELFEKVKTTAGKMILRIVRLKRSPSWNAANAGTPCERGIIGGFRMSFRKSRENGQEDSTWKK